MRQTTSEREPERMSQVRQVFEGFMDFGCWKAEGGKRERNVFPSNQPPSPRATFKGQRAKKKGKHWRKY